MENTIEVESAEVAMDISLEHGITRNGKSPNENYLLEQNHQAVCTICNEMNELVWMLFIVANVIVRFIINAHFYLHIS